MHHGTMQVCAAPQGRQEWVRARAVYPKARYLRDLGPNARGTFAFAFTPIHANRTHPYLSPVVKFSFPSLAKAMRS